MEVFDWTARLSKSHLKSAATAGKCQELRWTKTTALACSSVTANLPQFARHAEQKQQFGFTPPLGPRPQVLFQGPWPLVGANVQAPGEPLSQLGHQGCTPLYTAAHYGHREIIQQLIAAGPFGGELEDLPSEGRTGVTLSEPLLRDRAL